MHLNKAHCFNPFVYSSKAGSCDCVVDSAVELYTKTVFKLERSYRHNEKCLQMDQKMKFKKSTVQ